ncbi:MAG: hypothetical protein O7F69_09425 [Alphaproteobacteria bacterium]|nr:hypothetical protein [Alphaproteobacteria bacterium]
MISGREVAIGIYGAWRLLRFDRAAIRYFDSTLDGLWKSFYAALIVVPAVIVLRVLFVAANPEVFSEAGTIRIATVFAIDYVYQWLLFPLVMISLADRIGRSGQYITFIVARNWSQVIQIAIFLPAALLFEMSGADDPGVGGTILIVAYLVTWVYEWFITRSALDIPGLTAALIVLLGVAISFAISIVGEVLIGAV